MVRTLGAQQQTQYATVEMTMVPTIVEIVTRRSDWESGTMTDTPKVAVAPNDGRADWLCDAVRAGGGEVVEPADADAIVWSIPRHPERLEALLAEHPRSAGCNCRSRGSSRSSTWPTTTAPGRAARACTPTRWPSWR